MVMVGQDRRLREPLRWTRGGRLAVAAAGACLLLAAIGLGLFAALGPSGPAAGCIRVTFPSTVGAATINACGPQARQMCADPQHNRAAAAHGRLRAECARVGLPYGA